MGFRRPLAILSTVEFAHIAGHAVSRIGLGTWAMGGLDWRAVSHADAVATCLRALDRGVNFIDLYQIHWPDWIVAESVTDTVGPEYLTPAVRN